LTCKVKSSEEWPTWVDRLPLNKRMRHVEDSDNIDIVSTGSHLWIAAEVSMIPIIIICHRLVIKGSNGCNLKKISSLTQKTGLICIRR
jgi:hypothetical protein